MVQTFIKITDSIRYAETIQKSILPSHEKMGQLLDEYFVISKAKEVVSGDFYWISKIDNKIFTAVVDCTGHGVTGGFMTMIGHTLLNDIINQNKVYDPSKILEMLNKGVVNIIERQIQEVAIGMEVSLCVIEPLNSDENKVKITYGGAKRPLFLLGNNGHQQQGNEITEIKGDRQPVGFFLDTNRVYSCEEIILDKGSIIYMTSDGVTDLSNPDNKRFGTPRLKKILKEIAPKNLIEQRVHLETIMKNFQASAKQRDDITIMGVKV